jgi:hypothetical protein
MFPDSFGRLVVGYAGQKASVVLDLPVEFNALVTHRLRIRANLKKIPTGRRGARSTARSQEHRMNPALALQPGLTPSDLT